MTRFCVSTSSSPAAPTPRPARPSGLSAIPPPPLPHTVAPRGPPSSRHCPAAKKKKSHVYARPIPGAFDRASPQSTGSECVLMGPATAGRVCARRRTWGGGWGGRTGAPHRVRPAAACLTGTIEQERGIKRGRCLPGAGAARRARNAGAQRRHAQGVGKGAGAGAGARAGAQRGGERAPLRARGKASSGQGRQR